MRLHEQHQGYCTRCCAAGHIQRRSLFSISCHVARDVWRLPALPPWPSPVAAGVAADQVHLVGDLHGARRHG